MKATHQGSCHRGATAFEADIDLADGTGQCNGSVCARTSAWDAPADYPFGTRSMHHLFCRHCRVRPFGRGHLDVLGGDFLSVNVACLDDADPQSLAEAPLRDSNGRDNDGMHPPAETRQL